MIPLLSQVVFSHLPRDIYPRHTPHPWLQGAPLSAKRDSAVGRISYVGTPGPFPWKLGHVDLNVDSCSACDPVPSEGDLCLASWFAGLNMKACIHLSFSWLLWVMILSPSTLVVIPGFVTYRCVTHFVSISSYWFYGELRSAVAVQISDPLSQVKIILTWKTDS